MTPYTDQEIHGNEHRLPEDEEEDKVQSDEDADHSRLERQKEGEELLDVIRNPFPGSEDRERRKKSGQQNKDDAQPVHTQRVIDRRIRNPGMLFDELHTHCGGAETHKRSDRQRKLQG